MTALQVLEGRVNELIVELGRTARRTFQESERCFAVSLMFPARERSAAANTCGNKTAPYCFLKGIACPQRPRDGGEGGGANPQQDVSRSVATAEHAGRQLVVIRKAGQSGDCQKSPNVPGDPLAPLGVE